jgi:hypothetical protein
MFSGDIGIGVCVTSFGPDVTSDVLVGRTASAVAKGVDVPAATPGPGWFDWLKNKATPASNIIASTRTTGTTGKLLFVVV